MSFKSFPVYRLEELIGEQTLKRVASILPAFDPNMDTDSIYTKNNLVKVIYSFFDSDNFSKNELRKEFLSYQKEEKLNDFCEKVEINKSISFDEKIDRIVSKG